MDNQALVTGARATSLVLDGFLTKQECDELFAGQDLNITGPIRIEFLRDGTRQETLVSPRKEGDSWKIGGVGDEPKSRREV